jgi:hypothetical protein
MMVQWLFILAKHHHQELLTTLHANNSKKCVVNQDLVCLLALHALGLEIAQSFNEKQTVGA